MRTGELAEKASVNIQALLFYEREELLRPLWSLRKSGEAVVSS
jgi:DNA-binding transcriptional MerR regulator